MAENEQHRAKDDPHGLTATERAFVVAFFGPARFNATEAAALAGYKSDTSRRALAVTAWRLTHRPRVRAAMAAEHRKRAVAPVASPQSVPATPPPAPEVPAAPVVISTAPEPVATAPAPRLRLDSILARL